MAVIAANNPCSSGSNKTARPLMSSVKYNAETKKEFLTKLNAARLSNSIFNYSATRINADKFLNNSRAIISTKIGAVKFLGNNFSYSVIPKLANAPFNQKLSTFTSFGRAIDAGFKPQQKTISVRPTEGQMYPRPFK